MMTTQWIIHNGRTYFGIRQNRLGWLVIYKEPSCPPVVMTHIYPSEEEARNAAYRFASP